MEIEQRKETLVKLGVQSTAILVTTALETWGRDDWAYVDARVRTKDWEMHRAAEGF